MTLHGARPRGPGGPLPRSEWFPTLAVAALVICLTAAAGWQLDDGRRVEQQALREARIPGVTEAGDPPANPPATPWVPHAVSWSASEPAARLAAPRRAPR